MSATERMSDERLANLETLFAEYPDDETPEPVPSYGEFIGALHAERARNALLEAEHKAAKAWQEWYTKGYRVDTMQPQLLYRAFVAAIRAVEEAK